LILWRAQFSGSLSLNLHAHTQANPPTVALPSFESMSLDVESFRFSHSLAVPHPNRATVSFHFLFETEYSTMSASRWGKNQTKALRTLFHSKVADPVKRDTEYVDAIWEDALPILKNFSKDRFRHHYREKAKLFLAAKAGQGIRRSEFSFVF
jgi:hypothetical protein